MPEKKRPAYPHTDYGDQTAWENEQRSTQADPNAAPRQHAGKVSLTVKATRKPELDEVVWPRGFVVGGTTITHAAILDAAPRTWRERLFSLPWRPWVRNRPPIVVELGDARD